MAPTLLPYLTSELTLTGLIQVMDGDTALKVVATIGLIAYSLGVASLMRAVHLPLAAGIPLLAFEMSYLFMLGLTGFVWGIALCLFAVALALRRPPPACCHPPDFAADRDVVHALCARRRRHDRGRAHCVVRAFG